MVRALQTGPRGRVLIRVQWLAFGADIKLFTQVWLAAGDLRRGAVVAAKVRRVEHTDRQFVGLGQRKKCARLLLHLSQQRRVDAVAGQVEKADLPRGSAQRIEKFAALLRRAVKLRQIQQRQGGD